MDKPVTTTEKFYMACDAPTEGQRSEYGPFKTSSEAEQNARSLGWNWVLVYYHTVQGDVTIDMKERLYELTPSLDQLRSVVSGVKPMTTAEENFFAQYEKQMES